jgi:hypothetical protein
VFFNTSFSVSPNTFILKPISRYNISNKQITSIKPIHESETGRRKKETAVSIIPDANGEKYTDRKSLKKDIRRYFFRTIIKNAISTIFVINRATPAPSRPKGLINIKHPAPNTAALKTPYIY